MSIRLMTLAWAAKLSDSEKLVLLSLADWSDDSGNCWPSVAQLAAKCTKGERTIQAALKSLEAAGHITREQRPGRGCRYVVHPRSECTPAETAPPQPATLTPAAAAPNTSGNTNPSEAKASSEIVRKSDFPLFWDVYPHKVGKLKAERSFDTARVAAPPRRLPPIAELLAAVERYKRNKPPDVPWCNPATWLNQGRWLDDAPAPAGPTGGPEPPKPYTYDPEEYARRAEAIARQFGSA